MGMAPPRKEYCNCGYLEMMKKKNRRIKQLEFENKKFKNELEKAIDFVAQSGMLHLTEFCDHCIGSVGDCNEKNCKKTFKTYLNMSNENDN